MNTDVQVSGVDRTPSHCHTVPAETEVSVRCLTTQLDSEAALHQQEEKEQAAHGTLGPTTEA